MGQSGFRACPSKVMQEGRRTVGTETNVDAFEGGPGDPSTVCGQKREGFIFLWLLASG